MEASHAGTRSREIRPDTTRHLGAIGFDPKQFTEQSGRQSRGALAAGGRDAVVAANHRRRKASAARSLLTRRELARALGVHLQTITKWENDGMPVAQRGSRGVPSRFNREVVERWRTAVAKAKARPRATGDINSLEVERARRERAQARFLEQKLLVLTRDLLPRADVERTWAQHVTAVRTKLLALPVALADRIHRAARLNGVASVERALSDAIRDVLRELADEDSGSGTDHA